MMEYRKEKWIKKNKRVNENLQKKKYVWIEGEYEKG